MNGAVLINGDIDFQRGKEKEAKRRRLTGVHIPVRMFKIVG